jgi:hypothetical protein
VEATGFNLFMIISVLAGAILIALGIARLSGRNGEMIVHRPYNNRYSDASGAREDHLS